MDKAQYKTVPVEPTPEMLKAGRELFGDLVADEDSDYTRIYAAMLAAAPQPPSASDECEENLREIADAVVGVWLQAGKLPPMTFDYRGLLLAGMRAAMNNLAPSPGVDAAEPMREPLSQYQKQHATALYCSLPHCMDSADTIIRNIASAAYMNGFHTGMHCAPSPAASADEWMEEGQRLLDAYRECFTTAGHYALRHDARAAVFAHLQNYPKG